MLETPPTEPTERCIGYLTSPSQRCPETTPRVFCQLHLLRSRSLPDYHLVDRGLDDLGNLEAKSTANLMKLWALATRSAELRQTFTDEMVALECRDLGHAYRVTYLRGLARTIEEILESRVEVPAEVEVPRAEGPRVEVEVPTEVPSVAPTRKVQRSEAPPVDWRLTIDRWVDEVHAERVAQEEATLARLKSDIRQVRFLGFIRSLYGGPILLPGLGKNRKLSTGSWRIVGMMMYCPWEQVHAVVSGLPVFDTGVSEIEAARASGTSGAFDQMLRDVSGSAEVLLVAAGKELLGVYPLGKTFYLVDGSQAFHLGVTTEYREIPPKLRPVMPGRSPVSTFKEAVSISSDVLGVTKWDRQARLVMLMIFSPLIAKKAYFVSKLNLGETKSKAALAEDFDLYARLNSAVEFMGPEDL